MSGDKERPLSRSAVFVVVENDKHEYLLQQRSGTGFLDGYYDVSGSGHLEYYESLETCGVRELQEETGLVVKESDLKLVTIFQSNFEADIHYLNFVYKANKFSGTLVSGEPTKISELSWYAVEDFPAKLTVGLRVFLQALKDGKIANHHIDPQAYKALMGETYDKT